MAAPSLKSAFFFFFKFKSCFGFTEKANQLLEVVQSGVGGEGKSCVEGRVVCRVFPLLFLIQRIRENCDAAYAFSVRV